MYFDNTKKPVRLIIRKSERNRGVYWNNFIFLFCNNFFSNLLVYNWLYNKKEILKLTNSAGRARVSCMINARTTKTSQ